LRFLAGRATAGVEHVTDRAYLRTAAVGCHQGWIKVEPIPGRDALAVELATSLVPVLPDVLSRLKDLFDLNSRPDVIASHLSADDRFTSATARFAGLRVPGAFDGFELVVRAVLGQRISVRAATTLAGRVAACAGEPIETPFSQLNRLSPAPDRLADLPEKAIQSLGISAPRAQSIRTIAQMVVCRQIDLKPARDPEAVTRSLQEIPGIGDWTAQYVAMRALRWPDAFPAGDLGLLKASHFKSPAHLRDTAEAWRPWRSYAAMYLWETQHPTESETRHV
jgi:AraC family transcriptional regulator of adaptative response / DNA-3-methyladenine glycosylase II